MTNKHLFSRLKNPRKPCNPRLKNPVILPALEFRRRGSNFSSCLSGEKICAICGNSMSLKDLRACKALYNCRETFTDVMSALQNKLFMQNKANFRKVKLNVNEVLTRDYVQMDTWSIGKTKPIQSQSKPIQSQLKPIKC